MTRALFAFFLFLVPSLLFSGEVRTITCEQAVALTLKNNLDILQAEKDIKVARIQLGQSYADLFMPNISGSGSFTYSGSEAQGQTGYQTTNIAGQDYVIANNYPDNYSAGLSVSKTLFNGLSLWNSKEIQQKNLDQSVRQYQDTVQTNRVNAIKAFYNVLLQKQNLQVSEMTGKGLKDRLDYITDLYKKGRTNELAWLQALVNSRNHNPTLVQASNDYASARKDLCVLTGLSDSEPVEFTGDLPEMTNSFTNGSDFTNMAINALSNDSTLRSVNLELDTAVLNRTTSDLSKLPSVSANFNYRYDFKRDNSFFGIRTWQPSWNAGLSLNVPVDNWLFFSKQAQVSDQYSGTIEKLTLTRTQRVQNILTQVEKSLMELKVLQETLDSQTDSVRLAKRQLELSQEQYKRGNVSPLDLQDSDTAYREADLAYWQAFYNYASAALAFRSMTRNQGDQP